MKDHYHLIIDNVEDKLRNTNLYDQAFISDLETVLSDHDDITGPKQVLKYLEQEKGFKIGYTNKIDILMKYVNEAFIEYNQESLIYSSTPFKSDASSVLSVKEEEEIKDIEEEEIKEVEE